MSLKNRQAHGMGINFAEAICLVPGTKNQRLVKFPVKKEEVEPGIEPGSSSLQAHPPTS